VNFFWGRLFWVFNYMFLILMCLRVRKFMVPGRGSRMFHQVAIRMTEFVTG